MNEWAQGAGDAEKEHRALIDYGMKSGSGPRAFPGDPEWFNRPDEELRAGMARVQAEDATTTASQSAMALSKAQNQDITAEAEKRAAVETRARVLGIMNGGIKLMGKTIDLKGMLEKAQSAQAAGTPWTQQELDTFRPALSKLRLDVETAVDQVFDNPWDKNGNSYRSNLDTVALDNIKKQALAPLEALEKAIVDKEVGVIKGIVAQQEAQVTDDVSELLSRNDLVRKLKATEKLFGPNGPAMVLNSLPQGQSQLVDAMLAPLALSKHERRDPNDPKRTSMSGDMKQVAGEKALDGKTKTAIAKGLITEWTNIVDHIGGPEQLDTATLTREVDYMFSEQNYDILSRMRPEDQVAYFNKVASPEVTKKILQLRDSGNTAVWDQYQKWVINMFHGMNKDKLDAVSNLLMDRRVFDVQWDKEKGAFAIAWAPGRSELANLPYAANGDWRRAEQAINEFNSSFAVIKPVMKDMGVDAAQQLVTMFEEMGYENTQKANPSIPARMMEALQNTVELPIEGGRNIAKAAVSIWKAMAPFSPQYRAPEVQGNNKTGESKAPKFAEVVPLGDPKMDAELVKLSKEHPDALKFLAASEAPPKFETLSWMQRTAITAEAEKLDTTPQELINRGWQLAKPDERILAQRVPLPRSKPFKQGDLMGTDGTDRLVDVPQKTVTNPVRLAESLLGTNENADNALISEYLKAGGVSIDPSATAWCAALLNSTFEQAGIQGTGKLNARSFLEWGEKVTGEPQVGDVVVFKRGSSTWQGHVGFFQGYDDNGNIKVLGGNQKNGVNVSSYPADNLIGVRRARETPSKQMQVALDEPSLQKRLALAGGDASKLPVEDMMELINLGGNL
jgi:uncharacterized protein (TIGR02594 family)